MRLSFREIQELAGVHPVHVQADSAPGSSQTGDKHEERDEQGNASRLSGRPHLRRRPKGPGALAMPKAGG